MSIHSLTNLFLANASTPAEGPNMMRTLMFFGIVLVFFYLILWRPEQKRRKQMDTLRKGLKAGNRVTAMGIIGEVVEVKEKEQTVILKMIDGAQIEVLRAAISQIHPEPKEEKAPEAAPA